MPEYQIEHDPGRVRVVLQQDLTASVALSLRAVLVNELRSDALAEVVFDLTAVRMIDSTGIGLLISTANSLRTRKGRVRVENVSREILRIFQGMRLTHRLDVSGEPREAEHG
jgi:anti-anti-sigma factor